MYINVIIPVYNSERYLTKCITSVQEQSYVYWRIYAVDDGSKDSSGEILDHFAENDNRIDVYHIENHGAGYARNYALSKLSNDDGYVVFIDSDDYIEKDFFKCLASHKEDVVFIDVLQKNGRDSIIREEKMSIYSCKSKDSILRKQMTGNIPWGGCRKSYRTKLLLENCIKYSEHTVGEEAIFSFKALYFANSIGFINKAVYTYHIHDGSLSTLKIDDPWGPVVENLKSEIKDMDLYMEFANTVNAFEISAACVSLRRLALYYKYGEYRKRARERINKLLDLYDFSQRLDLKSLRKEAILLMPFVRLKMYGLIYLACRIRG